MKGTISPVVRRGSAFSRSLSRMLLLAVISLVVVFLSVAASAQVVTADFEDGPDGWGGFAGAQVAVSTAAANTGKQSLLTTNRSATYQGPAIDLTNALTPGQSYVFKIAVLLLNVPANNAASDTVKMTMRVTPSGGSASYNTVASGGVSNTGWTVLSGVFSVPSTGSNDLFLYIEDDSDGSASYYIDTFSVTQTSGGCRVPPDNSGFFSNFDDGTTQGWVGRGSATVSLSTDSHSGGYSLLVQGRTANWNGATRDITGKMCNGQQYWVEAWVKMAPGQPNTALNLSLQYTDSVGTQHYPSVATSSSPVTSGTWVRLKSKPYTFSGAYTNLQIYVQSTSADTTFPSFEIDDIKVQYLPPPTVENIPSIAQTYSGDFLVGFAALDSDIMGPHGQLAALHYNSVTPGNDLKWDTTEPSQGNFNFAPADAILSWAQSHDIKMRGHNFVWHQQVPNWVFQDANGVDMSTEPYSDANKALLLSRLKNHIDALINHYKNSLYVWDVVNEAIDETQGDGFRRSKWYMITVDPNNNPGYPEYMDDAFIYARQALDALGISRDQVELCYNDYNTTIPAKQQFIYNWVKGAISRGVPIDCVGSQFHNNITFPIDGSAASKQSVINTLNLFNSLASTAGKPIINEVTEFDMSLYSYGNCSQNFYTDYDDLLAGDVRNLALEGYLYSDYFQIFKSLKSKIDSVTIWGLGDDDSWLNPNTNLGCSGVSAADAPLPFDSYLQHKAAYDGIVDPWNLPGASLTAATASKTGPQNTRVWTIAVSNPGPGTAYGTEITSFTLTQTAGAACTPVVTPPSSYPVVLGDLAAGSSANASFTIDFTGCAALAKFTLNANYDSSSGTNAHTLTLGNQFR